MSTYVAASYLRSQTLRWFKKTSCWHWARPRYMLPRIGAWAGWEELFLQFLTEPATYNVFQRQISLHECRCVRLSAAEDSPGGRNSAVPNLVRQLPLRAPGTLVSHPTG